MKYARTVNGRLECISGNAVVDFLSVAPSLEYEAKVQGKGRYQQGHCKPPRPPHPRKWRGPRLRLTHKRPSRVPRRYRTESLSDMKHQWEEVPRTVATFMYQRRRKCKNYQKLQELVVQYAWGRVIDRRWLPLAGRCLTPRP